MLNSRYLTICALAAATALATGLADPALAQEAKEQASPRVQRFMTIFDTDNDDKVSLGEIAGEQQRLFGAIDFNGDGSLSADEFRRRGRLLQRPGTTTLFDLLDVNGDQKLTREEITAPSSRWFKRYDADANGALEAAEIDTGRGHGRFGGRPGPRAR